MKPRADIEQGVPPVRVGTDEAPRRGIRSYVLRQGRTSSAQARAVETLLPRFGLPYQPAAADLDALFGRDAPKVLEIGFGMGETTAHIAQALPGTDFLGVEVHTPGVGALLRQIDECMCSSPIPGPRNGITSGG